MKKLEITLSPIGREDIKKLESVLLVKAIFSPEVIESLKNPEERITWISSLAIAAAALARSKANMTAKQIADDIGVSESVIRNHLNRKTKAGELVYNIYEKLAREGIKFDELESLSATSNIKSKLDELKKAIDELSMKVEQMKEIIKSME